MKYKNLLVLPASLLILGGVGCGNKDTEKPVIESLDVALEAEINDTIDIGYVVKDNVTELSKLLVDLKVSHNGVETALEGTQYTFKESGDFVFTLTVTDEAGLVASEQSTTVVIDYREQWDQANLEKLIKVAELEKNPFPSLRELKGVNLQLIPRYEDAMGNPTGECAAFMVQDANGEFNKLYGPQLEKYDFKLCVERTDEAKKMFVYELNHTFADDQSKVVEVQIMHDAAHKASIVMYDCFYYPLAYATNELTEQMITETFPAVNAKYFPVLEISNPSTDPQDPNYILIDFTKNIESKTIYLALRTSRATQENLLAYFTKLLTPMAEGGAEYYDAGQSDPNVAVATAQDCLNAFVTLGQVTLIADELVELPEGPMPVKLHSITVWAPTAGMVQVEYSFADLAM